MANETGFIGLRGCTDARIAGLVGLLVGDALGVGFEFKKPAQIASQHDTSFEIHGCTTHRRKLTTIISTAFVTV